MNWTNRLLSFLTVISLLTAREIPVRESYNALFYSSEMVHATPHINNLIRNGVSELTEYEKSKLSEIGLIVQGDEIIVQKSTDLNQIYDTEHFRFYYTLDDNSNHAVEDENYVIMMGEVFEEVWTFYLDSMGFDSPPLNPDNDHDLYEIYIEYLSPQFFGWAEGHGSGPSCHGLIKMRNSYSGTQFEDHTELENIQVTAVHEFFHAIQWGYNCYSYKNPWFMEATAVWSEDELYDTINDHYRYMKYWFENPDQPISLSTGNFKYGSFIFFQYLDEHLGGREMIRSCWDYSREFANPSTDISFKAINAALQDNNSSIESAVNQMRVANQILSSSENAGIYAYEEAEGYLSVVNQPPKKEYLIFEKGDIDQIENFSLQRFSSHYYSLITESPVSLSLIATSGEFYFTSVVKIYGTDQWVVKSGSELNIDPKLGFEWIVLIVSAIGEDETYWDYILRLEDGYSEDFTFYSPYPNPSKGQSVTLQFQVITEQTIEFRIIDLLGQEVWHFSKHYEEPEVVTLKWPGLNKSGQRVANGIYFGIMEGNTKTKVQKITYLKKSD